MLRNTQKNCQCGNKNNLKIFLITFNRYCMYVKQQNKTHKYWLIIVYFFIFCSKLEVATIIIIIKVTKEKREQTSISITSVVFFN